MTKQALIRRLIASVIFMAIVLSAGGTVLAQPLPRETRAQLIAATVQVVPWDDEAG